MDSTPRKKIFNEPWHSFSADESFSKMDVSREGLDSDESEKRFNFYGPNNLPEGKKITLRQIILNQLINPLIFILIAAAVVSLVIGEAKDAIFIFIVIILNSALGTYQEYNAEKSASGLRKLMKIKARVIREGKSYEILSENVVPGDIVYLESGLKVPADIRLFETSNLEIDESFLTGESIAAKKQAGKLREDIGIAERSNMAFAGSTIISGRGKGIVVGTGINTQVGIISQNVTEGKSAKPPLILRMEKFTRQITLFTVVLSIILGIMLRLQGNDFKAVFFFVVALAVSAIPEGLPVALTVALSIAVRKMARRNVIVRKLTSVESLGSCTIIASDKTGTLTVNEQTAKKIILPGGKVFSITGEGYNGEGKITDNNNNAVNLPDHHDLETLIRISALANEATLNKNDKEWEYHGDAIDIALLGMVFKSGTNPEKIKKDFHQTDKIPYESERKFSASFCEINGSVYIGMKGAVETVISFCDKMYEEDSVKKINKDLVLDQADKMAKQGYRVLAFASGEFKDFVQRDDYKNENLPPLTFYGLVCFIDPLRPEAKKSIEKCKKAGIKVIMITGDHPATASTIAHELGILESENNAVTGGMLEKAGPSDSPAFEKLVTSTTVFARVSPVQKLEIVDVLIRKGEFVAVTGDGVNDAPALRRANIGVAMGSGTDVAKEVGSMIVVDDNFASIVAGIEEGRYAYDNVRKVIYLLISTGIAEIIIFILAISTKLPLPFLPVQLLWLNLVTNGIQDIALAFEGGEPGAMLKKPRKPSEPIFDRTMIKQTIVASFTMSIIIFGFWFWLNNYSNHPELYSRNLLLLLIVFFQNFHVFNCRSETVSVFKIPLKRNTLLIIGVIIAQGIHLLAMHIPIMQDILHIQPVTFQEWSFTLLLAIPIVLSIELFKLITGKINKQNS